MTDTDVSKKLDKFFGQFDKHYYQKGGLLIKAGDNPIGIFYLEKGYVRQYVVSRKGDEITLNLYKPHVFFPMMWALNDTPNEFYFEAISPVTASIAPKEKVVEFVKSEPDVLFDLSKRLFYGIDGLLKRMEYLLSGDAYKKLIVVLLISLKRFADPQKREVLSIKLTHKDLASQAGISRETVSREMKKLEKKGAISYTNHLIKITNMAELEKEFFR